jgi:hypothetical protein
MNLMRVLLFFHIGVWTISRRVFTDFSCSHDVWCSGPIRKAVLLLFDYRAFRTPFCLIL